MFIDPIYVYDKFLSVLSSMNRVVISGVVLLLVAFSVQGGETLTLSQWQQANDARAVAQLMPLKRVMADVLAGEDRALRLRYPDTAAGRQWLQELTVWLVSLGVSSDRIQSETDFSALKQGAVLIDVVGE